jgi:hypothetical protein
VLLSPHGVTIAACGGKMEFFPRREHLRALDWIIGESE